MKRIISLGAVLEARRLFSLFRQGLRLGLSALSYSIRSLIKPVATEQVLISIAMPTYNRKFIIEKAIASVLAQTHQRWELIVIDDGSTDGTDLLIEKYLKDPRIQYHRVRHGGEAFARNSGLPYARGEISAYLDSDVVWLPHYLATIAENFQRHPKINSLYLAQKVTNPAGKLSYIRNVPFDRKRLEKANFIDMNVFSHRRSLIATKGGFDESLNRLIDWEFILRYTEEEAPLKINQLGSCYQEGDWPRISNTESQWYNYHRIVSKHKRHLSRPVRALYVLPPLQLTDPYLQTEMNYLLKRGVQVEVCLQGSAQAPSLLPKVPIHVCSLEEAARRVQPTVIHVQTLALALLHREEIVRLDVPTTVCIRKIETRIEGIARLQSDAVFKKIYLSPELYQRVRRKRKLVGIDLAFDPELFYPNEEKNKKMVVGFFAGDNAAFFEVAKRCPSYRFVLIAEGAPLMSGDVQDRAALLREAAIYLQMQQTSELSSRIVIEALATGCCLIAQESVEAVAASILETQKWGADVWREKQQRAIDQAFQCHVDRVVFEPILSDWL